MLHQPTAPCTSPPLAAAKSLEVKKIFFFKNWQNKRKINRFLCTRPNSWQHSSPSQPHQKPGPVAGGACCCFPSAAAAAAARPGALPRSVSSLGGPWGPLGPLRPLGALKFRFWLFRAPSDGETARSSAAAAAARAAPHCPRGPHAVGLKESSFAAF
ncbi:hypothetical protein, conserved [Eimeria tenella]|uniref:Uncharacterized protein n=1 Tax=Eimeria tenella TaxID=5802 RepID=U6KVW1_EIMTE|nr:hypothetical protein, conserved [Eimeria tenella]CDJ42277.1 hypothetical protein, conserved [Eimeria tenella]|eukprot:XP_013233027.1 hypothetical protein, conserved [Eimeria tenella]